MAVMSASVSGRTYRGRKAANYEKNRRRQRRWILEHEAVGEWLPPTGGTVLDVPCGTGRFFELYAERNMKVTALDVSEEMMALARDAVPITYVKNYDIKAGDALALTQKDQSHDVAVCVRLLHLVSRSEASKILTEICRVARHSVLLTVRLAPEYVENPSSTTMPEKWFRGRIRKLGWKVAEERRLSSHGWTIMRLIREK
jgi:ubiquinone/menaquinone biosynthesis C-methylase UbiE